MPDNTPQYAEANNWVKATPGIATTALSLLPVLLAMLKVWLHSRNLVYPKRIKTLTAALMMSLVMLAPVCYWIALFNRARNGGG